MDTSLARQPCAIGLRIAPTHLNGGAIIDCNARRKLGAPTLIDTALILRSTDLMPHDRQRLLDRNRPSWRVGGLSVAQEIAGRSIEEDGWLDLDNLRVPKYHTRIERVIAGKYQCGRQEDCDANG